MVLPALAPAVWALVAGAGAESAYAWYDPDLFTKGIWSNYELDKRVETLNNYWQNLWRSGGSRLPPDSKAAKLLDQYMAGWEDFKQRYNDAIFRRALDPFGLWGAKADYESELNDVWVPRFIETMTLAITSDPLIESGLKARHVDMDVYLQRSGLDSEGNAKSSNFGFYLAVATTVTLIGVGALIASRHPARR
jgi:hypothetical protein